MLDAESPEVRRLVDLVRPGDLDGLRDLLPQHPSLATERHGDANMSRTALHAATDWPGHFPNVAGSIEILVAAGAPVDGRFAGPHTETPLHWAASSDDLDAIDALVRAGADLEASGAVLTGGTPLADAVVFAQWNAARRLVALGARMTVWQAAALDEVASVAAHLAGGNVTDADITNACWHACRAGAAASAIVLLDHGADLDWLGYDRLTCRAAGLASGNPAMVALAT